VPRPVWFEKGSDVSAVADHLEASAQAAKAPLAFEPRPLPQGISPAVLHQAALLRARRALAESHAEQDRILAQEVRAIDDLVRTANLLVERLREWYALHAPEATRMVTDAKELATLVAEQGDRASVMVALKQADAAATSLGTDLDPADLAVLQGFAGTLQSIHASWAALEARVGTLMESVAPNVASVVGPVIGARLIAISGGLSRLATWPSGTVQLLGAETALFRHLKEGTKPPKHGILFQHPLVHNAPPWQRGATARALALATSTASKADAFTKNDLKVHLKEQVDKDLARIALKKMPARQPMGQGRFPARGPPRQGGFAPRGPPRSFDGPRGPPRSFDGPRGPPRDGPRSFDGPRGPPRSFDGPRGPPRDGPRSFDGPRSQPRDGPRSFDGPRGPPRDGPRSFDGPRGPPRDGFGGGAPRSDGPRGPPSGGFGQGGASGAGKPWKRKPQGAFRSDNKPARPPGRGGA
jgi:nucleolar protein 56